MPSTRIRGLRRGFRSRSRSAARIRALAAALAVLSAAGCSSDREGADAAPVVGTEVGQRAPALQGRLATGETVSLAEARGTPVVLVFYQGAYCGLCREQLGRLQQHLPAYRALQARVFAVTPDEPPVSATLAEQLGLEFPIVSVAPDGLELWGVAESGDPAARPATFVVGSEGVVVFRHLGRNAADRATEVTVLTVLERQRRD